MYFLRVISPFRSRSDWPLGWYKVNKGPLVFWTSFSFNINYKWFLVRFLILFLLLESYFENVTKKRKYLVRNCKEKELHWDVINIKHKLSLCKKYRNFRVNTYAPSSAPFSPIIIISILYIGQYTNLNSLSQNSR